MVDCLLVVEGGGLWVGLELGADCVDGGFAGVGWGAGGMIGGGGRIWLWLG